MKANLILVVLLIGSAIVFAQESNEESLFNQGVEAYKQGRYEAAQQTFLQIWQQYPSGRLITATRLMLAKSYYKLGDYPKVENLCLNFFNKFPDSKYLDDMHHLLGNTMFKLHRYMRAVEEWLWVIENSRDPRLKRLAGEYTFQTMDHFLSPNQIEALRRDHPNAEFDGLAKVVLAKKLLRKGEKQRANRLLRSFLREQPNHFYADEARRLLGKPTVRGVTRNGFVFLKPTDPQVKKIGDEMELGMQYAIFEYRQRNPREKIGFQSFDVSPSVLSALKTAEEAMELNDPLCMIGPIQADPCAALSMMSRYERIPYIIPLSSQAGLTGLSQYSFQLNPDAHTKGRFLGDYASQKLQLKRIAVIAPVNEYGQDFVESFVEEVQANGAEIATIQWYYENAQDFTRQFRAVWREGIYYSFLDSINAVDTTLSEEDLKLAYQEYLDRTFQPRRPGLSIDSTDVPSTGIDGLLMVINSSELIQYFAPQVAFNNIQTQLLGNEGWNDPAQLRKYKNELQGLVYITAGYFDSNSNQYRLFMNRFRSEMKATPDIFHLLGYDIMKWLLLHYQEGISRDEYRDRLEKTEDYRGIMQQIQFLSTPRVNNKLTILQLNLGQLLVLE